MNQQGEDCRKMPRTMDSLPEVDARSAELSTASATRSRAAVGDSVPRGVWQAQQGKELSWTSMAPSPNPSQKVYSSAPAALGEATAVERRHSAGHPCGARAVPAAAAAAGHCWTGHEGAAISIAALERRRSAGHPYGAGEVPNAAAMIGHPWVGNEGATISIAALERQRAVGSKCGAGDVPTAAIVAGHPWTGHEGGTILTDQVEKVVSSAAWGLEQATAATGMDWRQAPAGMAQQGSGDVQAVPVLAKPVEEVLTPEMKTSLSRVYPSWRDSKRLLRGST